MQVLEENPDCCIRVESVLSTGTRTNYEFMGTETQQLVDLLEGNSLQSGVSYHEVFKNEINKMFFDVDFKHPPSNFDYKHIVSAIRCTLCGISNVNYTVHVAQAFLL